VHDWLSERKSIDAAATSSLLTGVGAGGLCLFGKLKMALMGAAFADDELLQGVMEVLNSISREELQTVLGNGFSD
jgi:hypothetical protein